MIARASRLTRLFEFPRNFWKVTLHSLDQLRVFRWLCGGIWIKVNGAWSEAFVFMNCADGSRILLQHTDQFKVTTVTFHETNNAIQAIEEF